MPAVPVALAEIEERLEEIRYRLNRRSSFSILAPVSGVVLLLAALLVWSAARATPQTFSVSLYATIAAAVALAAWAGTRLWRRRLSLDDAARLADARGAMQERLTTALWLAHVPVQPRLTAVLVADTVDRSAAWQVAKIVPRRVPFEWIFPLAGLAALVAALLVAPDAVPGPVATARKEPPPHRLDERSEAPPPPQPRADGAEDPLLDAPADGAEAQGVLDLGTSGDSGHRAGAKMSEQVRQAIREAMQHFDRNTAKTDAPRPDLGLAGRVDVLGSQRNPERRDDARQAPGIEPDARPRGDDDLDLGGERPSAAESARGSGDGGRQRAGDVEARQGRRAALDAKDEHPEGKGAGADPADARDGAEKRGKGVNGGEDDRRTGGAQKEGRPATEARQDPSGRASRDKAGDGSGRQQGGARAAAGGSGDADSLFAAKGSGDNKLGGDGPGATFKLTLGSFLSSGPSPMNKPQSRDRPPSQSTRAAVTEPPSLNPNQAADDVLRRADIPPEYEDVVRRIYSARPSR